MEWQSSIGSNRLAIVGDFMELMHLQMTEVWQEAAKELLEDHHYMYLKIKHVKGGGVITVCKAMTFLPIYPLKIIQLRRSGCYRGPLVIQTIAQC
jgi:hypothetical protein